MVDWYSRFIERESEIKLPLLKLITKTQAWQWSAERQEAFEKIKLALTKAPVLARPDFTREFTVQGDASNDAIGAVLSQEFEEGTPNRVHQSRPVPKELLDDHEGVLSVSVGH